MANYQNARILINVVFKRSQFFSFPNIFFFLQSSHDDILAPPSSPPHSENLCDTSFISYCFPNGLTLN